MSWVHLKLPGGTLEIKPRSHLRQAELYRRVPVLDLGFFVFSWWSVEQLRRDERERRIWNNGHDSP